MLIETVYGGAYSRPVLTKLTYAIRSLKDYFHRIRCFVSHTREGSTLKWSTQLPESSAVGSSLSTVVETSLHPVSGELQISGLTVPGPVPGKPASSRSKVGLKMTGRNAEDRLCPTLSLSSLRVLKHQSWLRLMLGSGQ